MRVLILGATGMLGHKLYQRFSTEFETFASIRGRFDSVERFEIFQRQSIVENVDASDIAALTAAVEAVRPDCVVNGVGVIKQSSTIDDPVATLTINSVLPRRLAQLADRFNFRLITLSTDCVYDGERGNYSEHDQPNATDLYGISKMLGEVSHPRVLTIRTSMIGRELSTSDSLVEWFLSNRRKAVRGFPYAVFSGLPTICLADIIADMVSRRQDLHGVYHVSADPVDKLSLLKLVNDAYSAEIRIEPDDAVNIDRSLDSTRFRRETGFVPTPWPQMIARMAADATPYDVYAHRADRNLADANVTI